MSIARLRSTALVGLAVALAAAATAALTERGPSVRVSESEPPARASAAPTALRDRALAAYGKLPLGFVENRGQTDARVRYYASGPRYAFYLTRQEVVLVFVQGAPLRRSDAASRARGASPGAPGPVIPAVSKRCDGDSRRLVGSTAVRSQELTA